MKFEFAKLDAAIEADWPVKISVPQDGGGVEVQNLTVRFLMVDEAELSKLGDGLEGSKASLRKVVVGFGRDETTPFTSELLDKMLTRPFVRLALNNAYRDFCLGQVAEKN